MNNLSKSLLIGLLENESKTIAFYGGGFKPPTKGHFKVVKKTLQDHPEITKLYVVVGSGLRNNISQDESYSIWNIYKKYLPNKVEIVKTQSPLSYIKNQLKENPEQLTYVIIGSREGDEDDIKDFNERKIFFEKYSQNVKVIDLKTEGGISGTKARAAAKISFDTFVKFLPEELTEQEQITIFNYIQSVIKEGKTINENSTYSQDIDYKQHIKDLTKYFLSKYPDLKLLPKITFKHGNLENAKNFFGKTAYYDPNNKEIILYTEGRHPKDIVRSFSHEFIHFIQDIKGELENISTQNTTEDSHLDKIEREAYLDGNITFRNWTDSLQESFYLDIPKFNQPETFIDGLYENINEINLSKDNAVEIQGDITGGEFQVGDIIYEYSIKNIPNPYKDFGSFYNIQFTPRDEISSTPKGGKENYIKILSTMYKIIVDFIEEVKPEYIGIASLDGVKNYHKIYAQLTDNKFNMIPGYFRKDVALPFSSPNGNGKFVVLKQKENIQEEKSKKYLKEYREYFLKELFEKDLPIIDKVSKNLYIVTDGENIEAKYDFRLEIPERNIWSMNWFFTPNNQTTSPEVWKQVTATSFRVLEDWLHSNSPKQIHISGNTASKTKLYKNYINKLETLLNNRYKIDNSDEDKIVLRSIEESYKSSIQKRMNTLNESYEQSLDYWQNGDINSKSKIERWNSIKKLVEREVLKEFYINNKKIKSKKDPFGLNQFARELIKDELDQSDLDYIEKIADEWFEDYGIDVNFTKHFIERVNDPRNGKPISFEELEELFVNAAKKYGNILSKFPEGYEAVLNKLTSDLNLPFVLKYDTKNDEIDMVAKTIMRKKRFLTPNPKLTLEGRYDSITNKISGDILKKWIKDFQQNKPSSQFNKIYENGDIYVTVDAQIDYIEGLNNFIADGGAYEEEDEMEIRFQIDPSWLPKHFPKVSMWLKDVIRHEIEHLTHGDSLSLKASKYLEDDTLVRKIINAGLLSPAQYFKLEKEVDANLQGMYLKAKKSKRPFREVIDEYLDTQDITPEEKEEILNVWRNRLPALNLPKF